MDSGDGDMGSITNCTRVAVPASRLGAEGTGGLPLNVRVVWTSVG
jgi:hypothetical protein